MTIKSLQEHEENLSNLRKYLIQEKDNPNKKLMEKFNKYAIGLEKKINQAKQDNIKNFDVRYYKIRRDKSD